MLTNLELLELIEKVKKGDEAAFKGIYDAYYRHVFFISSKICHNKEDVEDVMQDIFYLVYKNMKNLESIYAFSNWLKQITIRECYRKNKKANTSIVPLEDNVEVNISELNTDFLPEIYFQKKELFETLLKIIEELPEKQREITYLFYYAEMKASEIAELNKCAENTVYANLFKARSTIKKKLGEKNTTLYGTTLLPLITFFEMEFSNFTISTQIANASLVAVLHKTNLIKVASMVSSGLITTTLVVTVAAVAFGVGDRQKTEAPQTEIVSQDTEQQKTETPLLTAEPESIPNSETPVQTPIPQSIAAQTEVVETQTLQPTESNQLQTETSIPTEQVMSDVTQTPTPTEIPTQTPVPTSRFITYITEMMSPEDVATLDSLSNGNGNFNDINGIIGRYDFKTIISADTTLGKEYRMYQWVELNKQIVIGTYEDKETNEWNINYYFEDSDVPTKSWDEFLVWIE